MEWPRQVQYLVSTLLDLADTLQIAGEPRVIFHADTEQRERGNLEELGETLYRVELDNLALLVTVECRTRHTESCSNLVRPQPRLHPVSTELLSDIVQAHRPAIPYLHFGDCERRWSRIP